MGRVQPYTRVRNGKKERVGGYSFRRRVLAASVAVAKRGLGHVTRRQWAAAAACGTVAAAGVAAYATGGAARLALTGIAGAVAVGAVLGARAAHRSYAVHRHLKAQGRPAYSGPVVPTRTERAAAQARRFGGAVRATSPRRSPQ